MALAESWYNSNFQSAIGMTPFKALYGYEPPQPTFELIAQSPLSSADQIIKNRQVMSRILKDNLEKAQVRMKQNADKHMIDRKFEIGDWVFLKLQPYR